MGNTLKSSNKKTMLINYEFCKAVLEELYVRPFLPESTPRRIYHYDFTTMPDDAIRDGINLEEFVKEKHIASALANTKFHYFTLNNWRL